MLPGAGTLDVLELAAVLGAAGQLGESLAVELEVGNNVDDLRGEALLAGSDDGTLGVGERGDGTAELDDLEGGVLSDVTGTGDGNALAGERLLAARGVLDHVLNVVDETVTSGLGTDQRTTPVAALASEDTLPLVADGLVGTEHVTDLAATNTNVTSGNISVGTNVSAQLLHEGVAEATDLVVRLALGVEVGTTLTTTHVHWRRLLASEIVAARHGRLLTASKSILEDLLETQELEDGKVDGRVETETTLVRAEGGVVLDTVTTVDLDLVLVVLPDDTELDDTLGDGSDLESTLVLGVLLEESRVLKGRGKLCASQVSSGNLDGEAIEMLGG